MEKSISWLAEEFAKNISEILSMGGSFNDIELMGLREAKRFVVAAMGVYAQAVDSAIVKEKAWRAQKGYAVERRSDIRIYQSLVGEVSYGRTYFKKAVGGYEYLTDTVLDVEKRSRLSTELSLSLVNAAKDVSYAKSSNYVADGRISRQTVMSRVRRSSVVENLVYERRKMPELHIDADEDHVTLRGGKNSQVPLVSVYEGIAAKGMRRHCKNIFTSASTA